MPLSYLLPLRSAWPLGDPELDSYLRWVSRRAELLIVDGSPAEVFGEHHRRWAEFAIHLPPAPELVTPMGKVGGVLTGLRQARHDKVVIADDDVRYDAATLGEVAEALDEAEVVRPQNYFAPLPWHAHWETGRMLLNRMTGGDWPGTLGVRRSLLLATGGYDGSVMFENLELVRTVRAAGGREKLLLGTLVLRRPTSTAHFRGQRVRQAFDEIARPRRMAVQLAILPTVLGLARRWRWRTLVVGALAVAGVAELGRRRQGGRRVFPATGSLLAPGWVLERAVTSWLALGTRVLLGGVPYRGSVLRRAATPERELWERHRAVREQRSAQRGESSTSQSIGLNA